MHTGFNAMARSNKKHMEVHCQAQSIEPWAVIMDETPWCRHTLTIDNRWTKGVLELIYSQPKKTRERGRLSL